MISTIKEWIERLVEGENVRELTMDPEGASGNTAQASFPPNYDAQGFPEDFAVVIDIGGGKVAVGYVDPKLSPLAGPGETVILSRSAPGIIAAKIHLLANGTINLNGVEITPTGEIRAPQEVSAMNATTPVRLSTHAHPTAMGPSGPPTPGT